MTRRGAALAAVLAVVGCAMAPPPQHPRVEHAYVVLGPDGGAVARAIVDAATCPDIDVDGAAMPMTVRAPAQRLARRPGQQKASDFPVTVCELTLPREARAAAVAGYALALPVPTPARIVLLGDTGCRLFSYGAEQAFQPCNRLAQWPFARTAARAAATKPDLVIHVGDYHYRESACPPANEGCAGSPWGFGYDAWDADFLDPARPLLAAAAWIVVRGNHETCDRAGQGWWRLLDPRALAPRQDCNEVADDALGNYSAPYAVPLGGGWRVVVFDSSAATNLPDPPAATVDRYRAGLAQAFAAAPAATFFAVHHPPLAFAANRDVPQRPYHGNAALQRALSARHGAALFPAEVAAVLSGHTHAFEAVTFATAQPPQFVFGDGGTAVDAPLPDPFPAGETPFPGAVVRDLRYSVHFGFATLDRTPAGWTLTAYDVDGVPMQTCTLAERQATCPPTAR